MKTLSRFSLILTLLVFSLCITPNAWARNENYLRFINTSSSAQNFVTSYYSSSTVNKTVYYSKDGGTNWYSLGWSNSYSIPAGDSIMLRVNADANSFNSASGYKYFKLQSGSWEVKGDIMTLVNLEETDTVTQAGMTFYRLFNASTALISAKYLRIPKGLSQGCLHSLFNGCSNLIDGPDLSHITYIPDNAFQQLFYGCFKLTNISDINASFMGVNACYQMFYNCSMNLVMAPKIKAKILSNASCQQMFYGCVALQTAPDTLYATTIYKQTYYQMFYNCSTALAKSPVIMAETVPTPTATSSGALGTMFRFANQLNAVEVRFKTWPNGTFSGTDTWLGDVASAGTFTCPSALNISTRSATYVPSGWTIKYLPSLTFDAGENAELVCLGHQEGDNVRIDSLDSNGQLTQAYINSLVAVRQDGATFTGWKETSGDMLTAQNQPTISASKQFKHYTAQFASSSVSYTFKINTTLDEKWHYAPESTADSVYDATLKTSQFPVIEREDYHFSVWKNQNTDATYPAPADLPDDDDVTCVATWLPIYTFITTGGTWEDTETSDTRTFYGNFDLPTLTKIGCYDLTWSPTLNLEQLPDTPTTYTASWSEYQFTFHAQAGTWTEGGGSADKTYGAAVGNRPTTLPAITRDGYLFRGWNTASDASGSWITDSIGSVNYDEIGLPLGANGKYYAIWSEIFTFYPNNGTWTNGSQDDSRVLYKYNITADDIAISRSQYVFDGWNPAFDIDNMPSDSGSFTAQWLPELTFNPNGGKWSDESTDSKIITTAVGEEPTRNGYAFTEWDNSYNPASLPTTPTTFTAQWNAFTYTFDVATNGGTWDGSDDANKNFTEETLASLTNPQRTNHVFLGWNTAGDGSGNNFNIDHLPTANTTFYAQFSEVHFFSIKALTDNVTIGTKLVNSPSNLPTLSYSTDDGATWTNLTLGTLGTKIVLASTGDSVLFRGTNERLNPNSSHISGSSLSSSPVGSYWTFTATDQVSVTGNLMTLIQDVHPTNTLPTGDYCVFGPLFAGMPVVDASRLELPTVTSYSCYQYMFYNCTSLTQAPFLPATYAEKSAYCGMFSGCISLTTAPTIYATDNGTTDGKNGAFAYMFYNCSTLNNISVKFATWKTNATNTWVGNVASSGTFTCPSALLKTTGNNNIPSNWTVQFIPELTFNLNGAGHWNDLSTDNLIVEPETPLTTLPVAIADAANRVFYGWNTSANGSGTWLTLENQPVISTTAQRITYYAIYAPNPAVNITFSLSNYPDASWDGSDRTDKVISTADLLTSGRPVPQLGDQYFGGWTTSPTGTTNELDLANLPTEATTYYPIFHNYLCFTALADGAKIGSHNYNAAINVRLSYCQPIADGGDGQWHTFLPSTDAQVTLNEGQKVYVRGYNPQGINSANGADFSTNKFWKFNISNRAVSVSGNIMTLIDSLNPPTVIPGEYCFAKIFKNDKSNDNNNCRIQDASRLLLPDTTAESCFRLMFDDCATLQYPPTLPNVKTVAYAAYREMFKNCSNLISCGNLVADSICIEAYYGMFQNCTTLVDAPEIMATRIQETEEKYAGAMTYMFDGCTALRSMHVHFRKWGVNHTGTSSPTYKWMDGTTTNIADEAKFYCDGLPAATRDENHIQLNWKVVVQPSYVTQDMVSSQLPADNIVYISNGATLTLDEDWRIVKVIVGSGCKLTIPESYTLTVDSIILQGGDTTNGTYRYLTPEIVVNGHIQTSTGTATPILYDYLLNDVQYYTLALPYDVTINDITYLDGTSAVIGIQDYDGAARVQGKDQGAWRTIYTNDPLNTEPESPATTLFAGRGYTIYAVPETDKTYSRVRFPMHPDFSAAPEAQKSVSVYGYGCTDGKPTTEGNENNVGWNLIGNPYLATFGNSWVTLRMNEAEVVDYVIIPANDGRSYHPELMINASLPAFKNFFVQVFEDGTLSFDINTRAQQSPSRAPMTSTRIFAGITLSGNGQEDKMGLTLRDDYTEGYDPYADLSKWMNQGLNIYASVGGNNLTMAAVSADRAQSAIPLVVNTAKAGTLTFTLNHAWDMNIDELEHLYLEDKETGIITDLLSDSYAYEAAKGTTEGRFFLTAVRRNTPTSNEQLQPATATDVVKFIRDGRLFILRENRLYNAQGQIIR